MSYILKTTCFLTGYHAPVTLGVYFMLESAIWKGCKCVCLCVCAQSLQGPYDSLGISVAGGVGSPHGNLPLFIATMDTNGLAAKTQKLQVGSDHVYTPVRACMCVSCMLHIVTSRVWTGP